MENKTNTPQAGLQMVVIPQETLAELMDNLSSLKAMVGGLVETKAKTDLAGEWLESEQARQFLGIAPKTWQAYRNNRVIPFSQFGRKIYVKRADLEKFLQDCRVSK